MTDSLKQLGAEPRICRVLSVFDLMSELVKRRPVFHSETDLQHAFARALWELAPEIESRLEVPQSAGKSEYLDLLCRRPHDTTAIEFKYWTRRWTGAVGVPPETYRLKTHGATDLARLHFVSDIVRLERFRAGLDQNGLAIMLTNDPSLWESPGVRSRNSRDRAFRIHEGQALAGKLSWGNGDCERNDRELKGEYKLSWRDYTPLDSPACPFRYLVVETRPARFRGEFAAPPVPSQASVGESFKGGCRGATTGVV